VTPRIRIACRKSHLAALLLGEPSCHGETQSEAWLGHRAFGKSRVYGSKAIAASESVKPNQPS
jgi:hypothetical protein